MTAPSQNPASMLELLTHLSCALSMSAFLVRGMLWLRRAPLCSMREPNKSVVRIKAAGQAELKTARAATSAAGRAGHTGHASRTC